MIFKLFALHSIIEFTMNQAISLSRAYKYTNAVPLQPPPFAVRAYVNSKTSVSRQRVGIGVYVKGHRLVEKYPERYTGHAVIRNIRDSRTENYGEMLAIYLALLKVAKYEPLVIYNDRVTNNIFTMSISEREVYGYSPIICAINKLLNERKSYTWFYRIMSKEINNESQRAEELAQIGQHQSNFVCNDGTEKICIQEFNNSFLNACNINMYSLKL